MAHRVVAISADEMRERFEEAGFRFPEDIGVSVRSMIPQPTGARLRDCFPPGTMTVMLSYVNDETGIEVARAHTFQDPAGNILGSGIPDPKSLLIGNTLFIVKPEPLRPC
jgi:hypothetical protein